MIAYREYLTLILVVKIIYRQTNVVHTSWLRLGLQKDIEDEKDSIDIE